MQGWKNKLVEFNKKYAKEIAAVATANDKDLAVGSDMFRYNLGKIAQIPSFYKGIAELDKMVADFLELEAARSK
jgi:hypothetical protein